MYELDKAIPGINVYSRLKQSMPVTGQPGCNLHAVSVILDADGYIIETDAHIWPE